MVIVHVEKNYYLGTLSNSLIFPVVYRNCLRLRRHSRYQLEGMSSPSWCKHGPLTIRLCGGGHGLCCVTRSGLLLDLLSQARLLSLQMLSCSVCHCNICCFSPGGCGPAFLLCPCVCPGQDCRLLLPPHGGRPGSSVLV